MENTKNFFALVGLSLFSFIVCLDATIVSTALPAIQTGLHMSMASLQWIMNAFFLAIGAFMSSMGKVGDLYGRRRVIYVAGVIFGLASIGAGFSPNGEILILFRAIQGISGAVTIPVGITLIQTIFKGDAATQAMGIFSALTGGGLAFGPVIGGALVASLGWEWVFFVNVPIVAVGFLLCLPTVEESYHRTEDATLDVAGVILLVILCAGAIFGVVESSVYGWGSWPIISSFVIAIIALFLFIWVERRVKHPVVDLSLFRHSTFLTVVLYSVLAGGSMGVVLFVSPLYLSVILNESHFMVGIYLFFIPLIVMVGSPFVAKCSQVFSNKSIMLLGIAAYFLAAILYLCFSNTMSYFLVLGAFMIFGLAWGIFNTLSGVTVGQSVDEKHLGSAMGLLYSAYNISSAVLLAVGVTLFHWRVMHNLIQNFSSAQASLLNQFVKQPVTMNQVASRLSASHPHAIQLLSDAFLKGMHIMFWPSIVFAVFVFLLMWGWMKKSLAV